MKKALIGIMVLTLIGIFGATHALAQNTGSISVTVTILSAIEISVSPDSWTPSVSPNSTVDTISLSPGPKVINSSNTPIALAVEVGNGSSSWVFADDPSGSVNFAMDFSPDEGLNWEPITIGGITFASSVTPYTDVDFDLLLYSPTQATSGDSFEVTITAAPPSP